MRVLPPALRSVSPAELAERLHAERRGVPLVLYLDGDGHQRIVELDGPPPSNREIAERLVVSVETVKSHLQALFELFGVPDMPQNRKRAEVVRRAFERGIGMEPD